MRRTRARLFAPLCALALVLSCDKNSPFAPEDDPALAALNGGAPRIAAAAVSASRIDLTWPDASTNESGYEIESAPAEVGPFVSLSIMAPDVTGYSHTGLTASTQYCYRIRSFKTTGKKVTYSVFSNVACATTQETPPPPPPLAVAGGLTFGSLSASAGSIYTCGIAAGGAAHCWGVNDDGQLGTGSTANSTVPVMVTGGLTFAMTSAGWYHACGVTVDGVAYCWGRNYYGELGNGSTTDSPFPVKVAGQP